MRTWPCWHFPAFWGFSVWAGELAHSFRAGYPYARWGGGFFLDPSLAPSGKFDFLLGAEEGQRKDKGGRREVEGRALGVGKEKKKKEEKKKEEKSGKRE